MEDILKILQQAKLREKLSKRKLHDLLNYIISYDKNITYDWDEWAGEEWITFLINDELLARFCVKIPIIFIADKFKDIFNNSKIHNVLQIVDIKDFDTNYWKLNLEQFNELITEIVWHASEESVNPNSFSTNDFWFATI